MDSRVFEMYKDGLERSSVFRALKEAWRFSSSASGSEAAAGEFGKITGFPISTLLKGDGDIAYRPRA